MAHFKPIAVARPGADKVSLVTCKSYDDYSAAELAAQLDFNPYSFLHVLNPAYVNQQKIGLEKRFKLVAQKYADFKADGTLIGDPESAFYLYRIESKHGTFQGIVGGCSVDDYRSGVIKQHEDTLQYRVELFKDYLHQTRFNTEPVLIAYEQSETFGELLDGISKTEPIYRFSTPQKDTHTLWKIAQNTDIDTIQNYFAKQKKLYIADGHHRSASADLLEKQYANEQPASTLFLSFLIAEQDIKIFEYNRIIRDLAGLSEDEFLKEIEKHFWVTHKGKELYKPEQKYHFGMYFRQSFYKLQFKNPFDLQTIEEKLDAHILYRYVLNPILKISDLRNDERIDYIPGKQSITTIKEVIDEGEYEVGFLLFPSSISEIKELADHNFIMPPKSTYFEPKFRSGLIIYEL